MNIVYELTPATNQVWSYDQAHAQVNKDKGFCAGLMIYWILLRTQGQDFTTKYDNEENATVPDLSEHEMTLILQNQIALEKHTGREGYDSLFQTHNYTVPKSGTSSVDSRLMKDLVSLQGVVDQASLMAINGPTVSTGTNPGTWFIMRFRPEKGKKGSGHAVAIEVLGANPTTQQFRLMDPGIGCFQFTGVNEFKNWATTRYFKSYEGSEVDKTKGYGTYDRVKLHKIERVAVNPEND